MLNIEIHTKASHTSSSIHKISREQDESFIFCESIMKSIGGNLLQIKENALAKFTLYFPLI
jgi:hypothetical protein